MPYAYKWSWRHKYICMERLKWLTIRRWLNELGWMIMETFKMMFAKSTCYNLSEKEIGNNICIYFNLNYANTTHIQDRRVNKTY